MLLSPEENVKSEQETYGDQAVGKDLLRRIHRQRTVLTKGTLAGQTSQVYYCVQQRPCRLPLFSTGSQTSAYKFSSASSI